MVFNRRKILILGLSVLLFWGLVQCRSRQQPEKPVADQPLPSEDDPERWLGLLSSVVTINTYDGNRILETGQGFFVDSHLVVTRLSLMNAANRAMIFSHDGQEGFEVSSYAVLDRISDLIILKTNAATRAPVQLYTDSVPNSAKTFIVARPAGGILQLRTGRVESLTHQKGVPL
jgi:peptidyl-prolyl cis-trans isomerase A (cyclophilin A)